MKKLIILSLFLNFIFMTNTMAQYVNVRGYTKSNGTYVAPHTRTVPDGIQWNNKSYRGF